MQLTRLEIKGFKSFADKVIVHFDKGITGIVGPNGCGKSNVVDAIRWVLGEQRTKALRSEKMENIIFNGSKNRKPLQLAEVELTFLNTKNILPTEYSQVTITRRYFRTGESEYLLNGVTCRLKDIVNLFMDTGIHSNSYAIIELKMVDDILNDVNNSRRLLFEEAAGISKFKTRKKETLKKLEDTDGDLARVEDLLFEIDKNLRSLERQAKQAEKYYQLKGEYKAHSIALAARQLKGYHIQLNVLEEKINQETQSKINYTAQIATLDAQTEKEKNQWVILEKEVANHQKTVNDHVAKIRQYESDKKIAGERLRYLNDKANGLQESMDSDKKSIDRTEFSIIGLNREREAAEKILMEMQLVIDKKQAELQQQRALTDTLRNRYVESGSLLTRERNLAFELSKQVEIKNIQIKSLQDEWQRSLESPHDQDQDINAFEKKLQALEITKNEKHEQLLFAKNKENETKSRLLAEEKTLEIIKDELNQTARSLDAKQNEFNLTKSLVENLEGFPEAIKYLKKHSAWNKEAALLSDVIVCSEEHKVVIENYLEPYMNYYVVETESDAWLAINLLQDAARGKAHFFILDKLQTFKPSAFQFIPQAIPATEVVGYDEKYKNLISYLLDQVYIYHGSIPMPDISQAILIHQSGIAIKRNTNISGGSVGLFEGKRIGRAKNLEKLTVDVKDLSKKLTATQQSLDIKLIEIEQLKKQLSMINSEDLAAQYHDIHNEFSLIQAQKEQFEQIIKANRGKREAIELQIETLKQSQALLQPEMLQAKEQLMQREDDHQLLNDDLQLQTQRLAEKNSLFNSEQIAFVQHQNKIQSLYQEVQFKTQTMEVIKDRISKNGVELKRCDEETRHLAEKSAQKDDILIDMYEEKSRLEYQLGEIEKNYYAARGKIEEAEKQRREWTRKREICDELLSQLREKTGFIKIDMAGLAQRLSVEFEMDTSQDLTHIVEPRFLDLQDEELTQTVKKLKTQIDQFGAINPMAMEAYQEIKTRHEFITVQRDDLVKAKDVLLETISEIDAVAKENFLIAFDQIKANFIKVFRSLFTEEDDCDLKLTDASDPLESPIEIMAKPKGKRPLTINQLSGGEKTLTAISLLFAIYLLKPAPFCIFDEVDAPLDDANIDKFNQIVKKFSAESQFIIVTHNKRTMSSVDIIYGITMIEQGISRVVPVDLRELDDSVRA